MSNGKIPNAEKQLLRTQVLKKYPAKVLGERGNRDEPCRAELFSSDELVGPEKPSRWEGILAILPFFLEYAEG
jgi:hypothetical protein